MIIPEAKKQELIDQAVTFVEQEAKSYIDLCRHYDALIRPAKSWGNVPHDAPVEMLYALERRLSEDARVARQFEPDLIVRVGDAIKKRLQQDPKNFGPAFVSLKDTKDRIVRPHYIQTCFVLLETANNPIEKLGVAFFVITDGAGRAFFPEKMPCDLRLSVKHLPYKEESVRECFNRRDFFEVFAFGEKPKPLVFGYRSECPGPKTFYVQSTYSLPGSEQEAVYGCPYSYVVPPSQSPVPAP